MPYTEYAFRPAYNLHYGGLVTSDIPEALQKYQSPDLLNVRPLGRGKYGPRNGIERIGNATSGTGVCRSLFTLRKNTTEILIRSRTTTLEYLKSSNNTWTTVPGAATYTNDKEFGFVNDEQHVFFGNGVENYSVWDGIDKSAVVTADAGADTLNATGHGFVTNNLVVFTTTGTLPNGITAGTVYFVITANANDFQISTTKGGAAVNITSAGTGTHTAASSIKQYSANPKGNIFAFYQRRVIVSGDPSNPATINYSKTGNPFDFTVTGAADSGGTLLIGDGGDPITSVQVLITPDGNASVIIFKKSRRIFSMTISGTDGLPALKELKRDTGAVNHRSTVIFENDIMFADEYNQVQTLGFRENITNDLTKEQASNDIDDGTPSLDFSEACGFYYRRDKFVIFSVQKYNASANNVQFVYYTKYKSWWKWEGLNANQFAEYAGQLVWVSSVDMNVYGMSDGFDDDGGPIRSYRATRDEDLRESDVAGADVRFKKARFLLVEGFISPNSSIDFKIIYNADDGQKVTITINGTSGVVSPGVSIAFGRTIMGYQIFGGAAVSPTAFPMNYFIAKISLELYGHLKMRIMPDQTKAGAPYVITKMIPFIALQPDEYFPDSKQI